MPEIKPVDDSSDKSKDDVLSGDDVAKLVNEYFLVFRNKVNLLFNPELGTIDDMIVTWENSFEPVTTEKKADDANPKQTSGVTTKESKIGHMHMMNCLRAPPNAEGKQLFNTFTINCTTHFTSDLHPAIAFEEQRKKKTEEVTALTAKNIKERI
jgi:hypothetical protein